MSITSAERHELHNRLTEVLGEMQANTLMEHLPPVGWSDLATKADLSALQVATRADINDLGTELRGEMADMRTELRGEMADMRGDLDDLRSGIHSIDRRLDSLGKDLEIERIERHRQIDQLMTKVVKDQRVFLGAVLVAVCTLITTTSIVG